MHVIAEVNATATIPEADAEEQFTDQVSQVQLSTSSQQQQAFGWVYWEF